MVFNLFRRRTPTPAAHAGALLKQQVDRLQRVHGYMMVRPDGGAASPVAHITNAPMRRMTFWVKPS